MSFSGSSKTNEKPRKICPLRKIHSDIISTMFKNCWLISGHTGHINAYKEGNCFKQYFCKIKFEIDFSLKLNNFTRHFGKENIYAGHKNNNWVKSISL